MQLPQHHQDEGDGGQAGGTEVMTADLMAHLGRDHGPDGHAEAAHGQQRAEPGRAEAVDRAGQADGQHVHGGQQAVQQHQVAHRPPHRRAFHQHLQPLSDLVQDADIPGFPGRFAHLDRAQTHRGQPIAEGQQQKLTAREADPEKGAVEQPQNRLPQGEAHDRGRHAGGLVKGIGSQQQLPRHEEGDRSLLRRRKKLGQNRFEEGHHQQGPVAPAQTQKQGAWHQAEGCQQHQQGTHGIGGHHHPSFGPAIRPDAGQHPQEDGGNRVGHVDACGQKRDALRPRFDVHADG